MYNNKTETGNTDIEQVIEDVMPVIGRYEQGRKVKAVDLFDPAVWDGASMSEHLKLGRIVADLVRRQLLPLRFIEKDGSHCQFVIHHD